MELKKYKLEEIADIIGGVAYRPSDICDYGIRILRGGNINSRNIMLKDDDVFLPLSYTDQENQVHFGDTILVASTGSVDVLGKAATCFEEIPFTQIGAFLRIIRPKEQCYTMLISIAVNSEYFAKYIKSQARGTSINNITINYLKEFEIYCPTNYLPICNLYSILENKILLNRKINQNLEAMAKQLYDYWFVQFDFPNEDGKPYKSSGGEMVWNEKLKRDIPASWKTKVIEDIADVYNGATPSTVNEQNYGGNIVWITPKDLSDQKQKFVYQGERNISQAGYNSCSTHLLPPNTILMSSRAPIGLLSIAKTELCTNQGFKSFVPKAENISTYLYYYLNIHIKQIEQLGTGTTFKEVSREDVLKFPILKPSDTILDLWEERVSALNNKQFEIQKENEYLTKLRDGLLPLLMNGQVSVNSDLSDD